MELETSEDMCKNRTQKSTFTSAVKVDRQKTGRGPKKSMLWVELGVGTDDKEASQAFLKVIKVHQVNAF